MWKAKLTLLRPSACHPGSPQCSTPSSDPLRISGRLSPPSAGLHLVLLALPALPDCVCIISSTSVPNWSTTIPPLVVHLKVVKISCTDSSVVAICVNLQWPSGSEHCCPRSLGHTANRDTWRRPMVVLPVNTTTRCGLHKVC